MAIGGFQRPGQDLQQRGLSGAVGADDAVAIAGVKLEIGVFEQHTAAVLYAEIGYCNHSIHPYYSKFHWIITRFR